MKQGTLFSFFSKKPHNAKKKQKDVTSAPKKAKLSDYDISSSKGSLTSTTTSSQNDKDGLLTNEVRRDKENETKNESDPMTDDSPPLNDRKHDSPESIISGTRKRKAAQTARRMIQSLDSEDEIDEEEAAEEEVTSDDDDEEAEFEFESDSSPIKKRDRTSPNAATTTTAKSKEKAAKISPILVEFASKSNNDGATNEVTRRSTLPSRARPVITPKIPKNTASANVVADADKAEKGGIPASGMFQEGAVNAAGTHLHNHLSFLYSPKLKDASGTLCNDPHYDPRTLQFGNAEEREILKLTKQSKLTPASKQWWEIKSQYFDAVLFFKTGKFYELYHMDADIGCKELGFVYMKGIVAHSGFPEAAYGTFSGRLIDRGYKVARVEQTETPEQLAVRKKKVKSGPKPSVVNREVCSISSIGTRTYCFLDDTRCFNTEGGDSMHGPLLSIREVMVPPDPESPSNSDTNADGTPRAHCEYGITIVDAVRSTITVGQFADDILRSRMHTLLMAIAPSEIILHSSSTSRELKELTLMSQTARLEYIKEQEAFPVSTAIDANHRRGLNRKSPCCPWDAKETISELQRKRYYNSNNSSSRNIKSNDNKNFDTWPEILRACVEGGADLALSSFGASLYYLQRGLIDDDILRFGNVKAYIPPGSSTMVESSSNEKTKQIAALSIATEKLVEDDSSNATNFQTKSIPNKSFTTTCKPSIINPCPPDTDHMQLDGTTLENLEILLNQTDRTTRNSLWARLNHTKTPHGNRLLKAWLLRPLFRKADIDRRADAVSELSTGNAAMSMNEARSMLSKVGDLERLLCRVHSMGGPSNSDATSHPDSRAMLYEGPKYTQRKVEDFRRVLMGLEYAGKVVDLFGPDQCANLESAMLQKILRRQADGGIFPDTLERELAWFRDNFDIVKAKEGCFEPTPGMDEVYDEACAEVGRLKDEFERYRRVMCSSIGRNASQHWKYINTAPESRDKYLIELPVSVPVPECFYVKGKRGKGAKQVNKYRTQEMEDMVNALERALDEVKAGKERGMQVVFQKFDSRRPIWSAGCQVIAILDALGSLAHVASLPNMVRPTILEYSVDCHAPVIKVCQGRHFCVDKTHYGTNFIPNSLALGGTDDASEQDLARVLLLSGPNMGGKSTLLRQTCLIAILGQIGCFVPAASCAFTPVDRIFTRLGATDRILSGQSTFFVELAETAAALRDSTNRSLVIMDELGRGTSTFDGTAIASATVQYLIERSGCLTLFATHYHLLLDEWKDNSSVQLGHMRCIVEDGGNSNDEHDKNITFLYTLGEGACPKSFGINVARLAGLPEEVLQTAKEQSTAFGSEMEGLSKASQETTKELLLLDLVGAVQQRNSVKASKLLQKISMLEK